MDISSKFDEVKDSLKGFIDYISQNNDTDITDTTFQLKKIDSTINELKKNNIPVPDELISLKLSLSSKIDRVKEIEKVRKDLIQFLELSTVQLKECIPEKPGKKEKVKRVNIREHVTLMDLINASILFPNIELYTYYKNNRFSATLTCDGTLEMALKKKKKTYENPRSAAMAITGYQVDPWKFWKLDFEGRPLKLDDYKKKYLKIKKKKESPMVTDNTEYEKELGSEGN